MYNVQANYVAEETISNCDWDQMFWIFPLRFIL